MSDESNEDLEEGHEHCPICNRINCPGAMDHCEHYFGSYWDGQVMWSDRFDVFERAWSELTQLVDEELGEDGLDRCRALATKRRVGKEWFSDDVWDGGSSIALMHLLDFDQGPDSSTGGMLSGSGYSLYLSSGAELNVLVKAINAFVAEARAKLGC
jgi:hypothetical protein